MRRHRFIRASMGCAAVALGALSAAPAAAAGQEPARVYVQSIPKPDGTPGGPRWIHVVFGADAEGNAYRLSAEAFAGREVVRLERLTSGPDGRTEVSMRVATSHAQIQPGGLFAGVRVDDVDAASLAGEELALAFSSAARAALPSLPRRLVFSLDAEGRVGTSKPRGKSDPNAWFDAALWTTDHSQLDLVVVAGSQTAGAEQTDAVVDLAYRLGFGDGLYLKPNLSLTADAYTKGRFTVKSSALAFQTGFTAGLSGSLDAYFTPRGSGASLLALVVEPSTFEATQSFDAVDYTAKLRMLGWVPGSRHPARWVQRAVGTRGDEVPATPIALTGTFVFASNLRKPAGASSADLARDRFDLALVYRLPISRRVELFVHETFYQFLETDPGQASHSNFLDTGIQIFIDKGRKTSLTLGYATGEVPPVFRNDKVVNVGFSARFN